MAHLFLVVSLMDWRSRPELIGTLIEYFINGKLFTFAEKTERKPASSKEACGNGTREKCIIDDHQGYIVAVADCI
jgi:hypothetical protein